MSPELGQVRDRWSEQDQNLAEKAVEKEVVRLLPGYRRPRRLTDAIKTS